ncbi:MAG: hypothetical protein JWP94_2446 [Mucilaginibacter sp.]|nr:hypothetical protein [Mucilaginibacter sp.]
MYTSTVYNRFTTMETAGKLTNVQIELLKLFQYNLPEKQLAEIKNMLAKYFAETATAGMDKLWQENNWNNDTMKQWANEHLRKK